MIVIVAGLFSFLLHPSSAFTKSVSQGESNLEPLYVAVWPRHQSGGFCEKGYLGGAKFASQPACQQQCESKQDCQFYCHGMVGKQWDCLHYSTCPRLATQLGNWSMADYSCYRRPPWKGSFVGSGGVMTSLRVPRHDKVRLPAIDLPTIKADIFMIDDVCDKVDEALGVANDTLLNVSDMMAPVLEGALSALGKAKIASEAADMFGASGVAAWITTFSDQMSQKVEHFQTKLDHSAQGMLVELAKAHDKFEDIRVNVLDKFGIAFAQIETLVEMVVNIVKATKAAVAAVDGDGANLFPKMETASLLQEGVTSVERMAAKVTKSDIALARVKVLRGDVSARTKISFNADAITDVKSALAQARTTLEPLTMALAELSDKIANGFVGQVLDQVQDGVGVLNQTAFDAVEQAGSVLPGIMRGQMQGMFNGALGVVDKISGTIGGVIEQITGKLGEANATQAKLVESVDMMDSLVDAVEPIFGMGKSFRSGGGTKATGANLRYGSSMAARLPSCGAALLLVFGLALSSLS